eukprot:586296-Pelagomonas_calceolata.AAC.1
MGFKSRRGNIAKLSKTCPDHMVLWLSLHAVNPCTSTQACTLLHLAVKRLKNRAGQNPDKHTRSHNSMSGPQVLLDEVGGGTVRTCSSCSCCSGTGEGASADPHC